MAEKIRFGLIGCGLMGKEFASACARWFHLGAGLPRPEIMAVCDVNKDNTLWFTQNVPTVTNAFTDYRELLKQDSLDAVYAAVPHFLHEEIYTAVIEAGKHLLGEKPFGMDRKQNAAILAALQRRPEVFARCTGEYPYFPGAQRVIERFRSGRLGTIMEVRSGIRHASDLDPRKPINWKRVAKFNGEYGCMGDLGAHTHHIPLRLGFAPHNVRAVLQNITKTRPDGKGGVVPCDTWDNATLLCECGAPGEAFPMLLETKRMSPGSTSDWFIEIYGTEASARFSSADPAAFHYCVNNVWSRELIGQKTMLPSITGGTFEFGFGDALLQMYGAFVAELSGADVPFGLMTPEETGRSHALLTAALRSHETGSAAEIE
ncbi:MAG: Gfo/Idh/MocA family oxidoreductase [Oscillospiraceae bacterium]|jgi:predicted dehydrogenase|nr:Gfo/Idh/MocA family oxidoreductase [Oscillospiraceae bacterium]